MLEPNDFEIDLDKLKEEIRDEVAKRRRTNTAAQSSSLPCVTNDLLFRWPDIMASLSMAEQNVAVGTSVPPMLRFRKGTRWLAKLMARVVIYLANVVTAPQRLFNQWTLQALRFTVEGARDLSQSVHDLREGLLAGDSRLAGLQDSVHDLREGLLAGDSRVASLQDSVHDLRRGLLECDSRLAGLQDSVTQDLVELRKADTYSKTELIQQGRRLAIFLEEARKRLPQPFDQEQLQTFTKEELHLLDPLYISFEDQFRGTRQEIKDRLKFYLPLVREAQAGLENRLILDVGCGRGEWLELLEEEGLTARGLDLNRVLVEKCRERGMDVVEADVIEYLPTLPDASLGAVTGFHLIEHLPFKALVSLLDETLRVLKTGGIAIFETPNPQNILVGASNFYVDPTHLRPLHPDMMRFLVESRGFSQVEIHPLHPFGKEHRLVEDHSVISKKFNELFYGPQDYAVTGVKP
jgi:O-antigen chain-terminating methyltransferase